MAELHDEDYAWDHAGESLQEGSPLLGEHSDQGSFLASYNRLDHITISRRQAEYLLYTLQDNTTLVHTLLLANDEHIDPATNRGPCRGCKTVLKLVQDCVLPATFVLQVLSIILLSILESTGGSANKTRDATFAVVVTSQTINFIIFAISLPRLISMIWHRSYSRVYLIEMYVTSTLVFAGMYLMTHTLETDGWLSTAATHSALRTSNLTLTDALLEAVASELTILIWVKMAYTSLCTASMFGSPAYVPVVWYNYVLQFAQLSLSLTLILCLVSQAVSYSVTNRHNLIRHRPRRRRSIDSISSRGSGNYNNYGALDSNPPSRA